MGRGLNTAFLADAPCATNELVECSGRRHGAPEAFLRCERERQRELGSVDATATKVHDVDLKIAGPENPLQCAVAGVLKPTLDRRNHRLRDTGFCRKLPLTQSFALARGPN